MKRFLAHVNFVREYSPFYAALYRNVPDNCEDISRYPLVDQKAFWEANAHFGEGVLTSPYESGLVFKSGGTSGNPKYSYFTAHEWDSFTRVSGEGFKKNGIRKGDRIANLFYAGELYASFIYVSDLIKSADVGINYPIGGQSDLETIAHMISELNINVIAGVPTTIMHVVSYLQEHPEYPCKIDLILFGGESFYEDQLEIVHDTFPNVKVHSILYASVDGGELGYFDANRCENGEHCSFDVSTIMEIVDEESGEVITQENIPGKLVVTNLNRKLMPLIRYPVGDIAVWRDPLGTKDRKFKLLGRSQEGARIGPATLYVSDVLNLLKTFHHKVQVNNFQILITHQNQKDSALIKIVPNEMPDDPEGLAAKIIETLYTQRSMLKDLVEEGLIAPVSLQWCHDDEIKSNPRTGKVKRVLDERL